MRPLHLIPFVLAAVLALSACGGDSSPSGPGGGGGGGTGTTNLSATIDGVAWSAASQTIVVGTSTEPGQLSFLGSSITNPVGALSINLGRIPGPGTYPLGVNVFTASGGSATVSFGATSANTPLDGASGSITFTSISSTRAAGTFAFVAKPLVGSGDPIVVTNGAFDVPLSSGYVPVSAEQIGSSVSAELGGEPFNGATVVATNSGSGTYSFTASNLTYTVNLIVGPIDGPGEGPISIATTPVRRLTISRTDGAGWGGTQTDTGTIAITELTTARMKGTFTATLTRVVSAGDPLEVLAGTFDLRIGDQ